MTQEHYAHSLEGKPPSDWQSLEEHLQNVAEMARLFVDAFDARNWGYLAGLWHDVGKCSDEFKSGIFLKREFVRHSETRALPVL